MGVDGNGVRRVTQQQYNRLKTWAERRPSVALMGEFSAGKSTLMNFLIEEDLLPTRATATELPPVWLTYGRRKAHWVDSDGGAHQLDLAEIRSVPMTSRFIRIHATAEILEHCDIIDTPGISDPNLAVESWRYVAGQANMVLWCTSATQAWRETERSAWLSLPERLRRDSILVVTRADKLLTEADRDKVRRRLLRETEGLFASIVFMATHDAVQAKAELAADAETPLWTESGAAALLDSLAERFESIYERRSALLRRYRLVGEPDPEDAAVVQARRATEVRAVQSSRAQARHGSGGPYVLEPGAHSDGWGAYPVRPARPQGGTARPARPDAAARAELLDRLQAGLEGAAGAAPVAWALSGDAGPAAGPAPEPVGRDRAAREEAALTDEAADARAADAGADADADAAMAGQWDDVAEDVADDLAAEDDGDALDGPAEAPGAVAGGFGGFEADADDAALTALPADAVDPFPADGTDEQARAEAGEIAPAAWTAPETPGAETDRQAGEAPSDAVGAIADRDADAAAAERYPFAAEREAVAGSGAAPAGAVAEDPLHAWTAGENPAKPVDPAPEAAGLRYGPDAPEAVAETADEGDVPAALADPLHAWTAGENLAEPLEPAPEAAGLRYGPDAPEAVAETADEGDVPAALADLLHAETAGENLPEPLEPAPEAVEAVLPAAVLPVPEAAAALPREVALWREVVARHPEVAAHAPLLAVIEEFLAELHALPAADMRGPAPAPAAESGAPAWRRLA